MVWALSGVAGSVCGCAGTGAAVDGEITTAAAAELQRRPELYAGGDARAFLVTRDGAERGLLWGTWHVGYDSATVLPREVRARFGAARLLLVEQVFDPQSAAFRNGVVRMMRRDAQRADPVAVARLDAGTRAALTDAGLSDEDVRTHSLSGLAGLVSARALTEPAGTLPGTNIVDVTLMGFARSIGMPVDGLEQLSAAQVRVLRGLNPNGAEAAGALRLALRRRAGLRAMQDWLREQYGQGRIGMMNAAMTAWQAEPEDLRRTDAGRAALLTRRNQAWMPRLEAALTPGAGEARPVFVAVGAAHLMGTDGVPALLRSKGWTVEACVGDRLPAA